MPLSVFSSSAEPTPPIPSPPASDLDFMKYAIAEAATGLAEGGVPIGACLVHDGTGSATLLGSGRNRRVQFNSATRHGEMDCLENIGRLPASVYHECTMYTTLSPCAMCSGACILYGIRRVVIGENETFTGSEHILREHGIEVINLNLSECKAMMKTFIERKPEVWSEDIGEKDQP